MGKHDGLSRNQKRKAKLKKRAERSRKHESLAYAGGRYKTDEYAPIFFGQRLASTNRTSCATVS